jgi:hypothetical protein
VCYCARIKEWAIGVFFNEVLRRILRSKEYRVKKIDEEYR